MRADGHIHQLVTAHFVDEVRLWRRFGDVRDGWHADVADQKYILPPALSIS